MDTKQELERTGKAGAAGETRTTRKQAKGNTALDHGVQSLVAVDSPDDPMPSDLEPGP